MAFGACWVVWGITQQPGSLRWGWVRGTGGHGDVLAHRSFSYMDSYNGDIRFDNIYISTYFRQIDERRKKLVSGHSPD